MIISLATEFGLSLARLDYINGTCFLDTPFFQIFVQARDHVDFAVGMLLATKTSPCLCPPHCVFRDGSRCGDMKCCRCAIGSLGMQAGRHDDYSGIADWGKEVAPGQVWLYEGHLGNCPCRVSERSELPFM